MSTVILDAFLVVNISRKILSAVLSLPPLRYRCTVAVRGAVWPLVVNMNYKITKALARASEFIHVKTRESMS